MTLATLFEKGWKLHWDVPRYRESGWAREVRKYWESHIADTLGSLEAGKITVGVVKRWHRGLSSTPVTANRCLEVLSRLFNFAEEEEYLPLGSNPCRHVKGYTERKRSRYASPDELRQLGQLLRARANEFPRETAFVIVLAVTGARPRFIQRASWEQLHHDEAGTFLRFAGKSTEKTGLDEIVVLPKLAVECLKKLPIRDDGLLFGEVKYRSFWEKLREEAGCDTLWLRDLRRTFASIGRSSGVDIDTIGDLLNHHDPRTTKGYAKLLPSTRLKAASTVARSMGALLGGREAS